MASSLVLNAGSVACVAVCHGYFLRYLMKLCMISPISSFSMNAWAFASSPSGLSASILSRRDALKARALSASRLQLGLLTYSSAARIFLNLATTSRSVTICRRPGRTGRRRTPTHHQVGKPVGRPSRQAIPIRRYSSPFLPFLLRIVRLHLGFCHLAATWRAVGVLACFFKGHQATKYS